MFDGYDSDRVDSDDLADILELSREDYRSKTQVGSLKLANNTSLYTSDEPPYLRKQTLNGHLTTLETEIGGIDKQIKELKNLRSGLIHEKEVVEQQLLEVGLSRNVGTNGASVERKGKGKARQDGIDYTLEFDWSHELKARMKKVFGIDNFRLCQEGVCNANMDGRDIVCVMPTGGGKSLTYQLPALLTPGCTLVISPLISLITDQILHLKEAGVEAVMLTGGTSKVDIRDITSRLMAMASKAGQESEIKLCYVTPEKIAKNKLFLSILEKLASAGKLARVVIDEAHCVSQLGHDYRPDYKKLSMLRQLFPQVPILALSATCPDKVLQDLLKILNMKRTVNGNAARPEGTVYFSAPLYRRNLHYSVLPKPSSTSKVLEMMSEYILKNHKNDSGIIYCLTKKDAESVAQELQALTNGQIKTGVYHAEVQDVQKESLHVRWRKGDVKVVCATIAFGLGIDKGNVRFVLHHSISKSLDGFYQESGRAGRDGQDADCVLYYRPQDATRLSSIMFQENQAREKLYPILQFAQDLKECRKILFAKYFSVSADLSLSSWTTDDTDALARCGHCDNCTRALETVDHRDVAVEAWQILKIADAVQRHGGRLTLNGLGDLVRGSGGGAFDVAGRGRGSRRKTKEKATIELDDIAGGKVHLSKDDTETLLVELLLSRYLEESYHPTAYVVNVYVVPGPQALRLTRLSRQDVENNNGPRVQYFFRKSNRSDKDIRGKRPSKKATDEGAPSNDQDISKPCNGKKASKSQKRKRQLIPNELDSEDMDDFIVEDKDDLGYDVDVEDFSNDIREIGSDPEDDTWTFSVSATVPLRKKPRKSLGKSKLALEKLPKTSWDDKEVITLSSD